MKKEFILDGIIFAVILLCGINQLDIGEWVTWGTVGCCALYLLVYYLYKDSQQESLNNKEYFRMAIGFWVVVGLGVVALIQRIFEW